MQFSISIEDLLKPLQQVCGILSNRTNIPVLNNVLLQIENNRLTITGTDLEVELYIQTQLSSSSENGTFTIPATKFLDICRTLSDDSKITVTF